MAARRGVSLNALAVRELTEVAGRSDNYALLADLPSLDIPIEEIVADLERRPERAMIVPDASVIVRGLEDEGAARRFLMADAVQIPHLADSRDRPGASRAGPWREVERRATLRRAFACGDVSGSPATRGRAPAPRMGSPGQPVRVRRDLRRAGGGPRVPAGDRGSAPRQGGGAALRDHHDAAPELSGPPRAARLTGRGTRLSAMRYHLTSFGCQMNEHDSERMKGVLEGLGYTAAERRDDADLILFNTCTIRGQRRRAVPRATWATPSGSSASGPTRWWRSAAAGRRARRRRSSASSRSWTSPSARAR